MTANVQRKRRNLFALQKGRCFWCSRELILTRETSGGSLPENYATIDHLDDRWSSGRGTWSGLRRRVLACPKCNSDRNRAREASIPIEELWRRSGRGPRRPYRQSDGLPQWVPDGPYHSRLAQADGSWTTIEAERVLYVDRGRTTILCDRGHAGPVTLVVKRHSPLDGTKPHRAASIPKRVLFKQRRSSLTDMLRASLLLKEPDEVA